MALSKKPKSAPSKTAPASSTSGAKAGHKVLRVSTRKVYTRPQFRRPHTYRRAPLQRAASTFHGQLRNTDVFRIIKYPISTDMALKKLENNNTLTFIVDSHSTKIQIREAIRKLYHVKVAKVNTLIRPDGLKKAYVRLAAGHDALDIAGRIGIF